MATVSEEAPTPESDRHPSISYVSTQTGKKIEIWNLDGDDDPEGIDWEEIILTTQEDVEAGRYAFNSEDYATDEEAMAALHAWIHSIAERVEREAASGRACVLRRITSSIGGRTWVSGCAAAPKRSS
jgi:hypothetical protein